MSSNFCFYTAYLFVTDLAESGPQASTKQLGTQRRFITKIMIKTAYLLQYNRTIQNQCNRHYWNKIILLLVQLGANRKSSAELVSEPWTQ